MNKRIKSSAFLFAAITLVACQPNETKQTAEKEMKTDSTKTQDLEVKLNATEAQLLNVRVELAKCKGDSLAIDSLMHETNKK